MDDNTTPLPKHLKGYFLQIELNLDLQTRRKRSHNKHGNEKTHIILQDYACSLSQVYKSLFILFGTFRVDFSQ